MKLIDLAKKDEKISRTLKSGKPSEVIRILQNVVGMEITDLADLYEDLEAIVDLFDVPVFWLPEEDASFRVSRHLGPTPGQGWEE
jgi:hypothetical protein